MTLKELYNEKNLYLLDGGMGSSLQKNGLPSGKPPEVMNFLHPNIVRGIHKSYVEAGADLIETNTFGGNRLTLAKYNLSHKICEINSLGVQLARDAAGDKPVVGSVGPTGQLLAPLGELDQDRAEEVYAEQCQILKEAGADLINIETISDLRELKAAVIGGKKCGLPIMAEVTFMENGYTLSGADPQVALAVMEGLGVAAGGINCGLGPAEIKPLLLQMTGTALPLIVQPNAGLPVVEDGKTIYPLTPADFSELMRELVSETKPFVIGGCCGTTPEHIAALKNMLEELPPETDLSSKNSQIYISGSGRGVTWYGDWTKYKYIEIEALNIDLVRINKVQYDLFGLIQYCKEQTVEIIRLSLDDWQAEPRDLKTFILELQLYYPGPVSVTGKDPELLCTFFHYFVGRPIWELSEKTAKWNNHYLPGTVLY